MTGKNPGKHGIYGLMRREKDSYEIVPINSTDRKSLDLWEIISAHGKRAIVMNVPVTYPVRKINGILIAGGFMTPKNAAVYAYPQSIIEELRDAVGEYRAYFESSRDRAERSISLKSYEEAFLEDTIMTTDVHARAALQLLSREWDFFMIEFQGTDALQHTFWKDMDETHPEHDKTRAIRYGNVIRDFYERLDEVVGKMVEKVGSDTDVILVSDHGFTKFSKFVSLNVFLMSNGYLVLKRNPRTLLKRFIFSLGITPINLFALLEKIGLGKYQQSLRKEEVRSRFRGAFISLRDVDWSKSVAYAMGGWGQIYLNLKGREPNGQVSEEEIDPLIEKIIRQLSQLRDPSSGNLIFGSRSIYPKQDVYKGPETPLAPEIIAIPDSPYRIFADYEFGTSKLVTEAVAWSGNHSMDGIFVGYGPDIKHGTHTPPAEIIDVAPTLLYLLGLPVPRDMDGRVLREILNENVIRERPIEVAAAMDFELSEDWSHAKDEDEAVKRTLRDLGYL